MLPTFVIGLREGLEASLIVGIVLAFLKRNGRGDLMRWALLGVGIAIALCTSGGIALYLVSEDLPQKQQEGLETVVGVIAVAMVTYMVVWMKRHSRDLKKQLEGVAGAALAQGSAWALVAMAFLAVLREGFETAVFLVAAFNGASNRGSASGGALLGIGLAVALGYGIYRGGVRINLSKFFRVTGFVLVLVAAGLVQTAFRTAHEAGWINIGQQATVDLSAVIDPGSVQSALITGMLGIQPQPTLIEFVAWLLYLVPLGLYVAWPQGKGLARRTIAGLVAAAAVVTGVVAGAIALAAPALPASALALTAPVTATSGPVGDLTVTVEDGRVRLPAVDPVTGAVGAETTLPTTIGASQSVDGVRVSTYTASLPATTETGQLTFDQIAALNGGRLPLGVRGATAPASGTVATTTTERVDVAVQVAEASRRIVDVSWTADVRVVVQGATGEVVVAPSPAPSANLSDTAARDALAAARTADAAVADRDSERSAATLLAVVAVALAVVAIAVFAADLRRRRRTPPPADAAVTDRPAASPPAEAGVRAETLTS
ncbi:iron uptake transporter permease EfeU [Jatrophihabitans sp. YIM 134969]